MTTEQYKKARQEFDQLKPEDKAAFLMEAVTATFVQGMTKAGKALADELDRLFKKTAAESTAEGAAAGAADAAEEAQAATAASAAAAAEAAGGATSPGPGGGATPPGAPESDAPEDPDSGDFPPKTPPL